MKSARQLPQYEEYQYKAKTSFFSFKNSKVRIVKSRAGRGRRSGESLGCHTAVLDTQPQFLVFSFQFTRLGSSGHDQSRRFVKIIVLIAKLSVQYPLGEPVLFGKVFLNVGGWGG